MNKNTTLLPHSIGESDVAIASGVARLLDANEQLERRLVEAAKTVSTSHRIEVRAIGESLYRLLDQLNGRLEVFTEPGAIAAKGAKLRLRNLVVRGEHDITRGAKELRQIHGLEALHRFQDEWTETYLDFASQLGGALDPTSPEADEDLQEAA